MKKTVAANYLNNQGNLGELVPVSSMKSIPLTDLLHLLQNNVYFYSNVGTVVNEKLKTNISICVKAFNAVLLTTTVSDNDISESDF